MKAGREPPTTARAEGAHVVLASVWHDDNKGDSAIAEGVLTLLGEARPGAHLTIASMLDRDHAGYATAYRHLRHAFPSATVVASPVPKPERAALGLGDVLRGVARTLGALVALALRARTPLSDAIARSDLVVANGGHTLYAQRGLGSSVRLVRILYPYLLARRFGRPYVVFGQSLGPFDDPIGRRLIRGVLRGAAQVLVREELSRDAAASLGVAPERLAVVPDPAFVLTPATDDARVRAVQERAGLRPGRYWVVTVRQAYAAQGRAEATEAFVAEMARFVRHALDRGLTERVAIVAHTLGPVPSEDDRRPARALHALVGSDRAVLIEDDLGPRALAALYGGAAWMIGTRFHSVILALVAGTPTLAVSYFGPKTRGIMKMLDLDDLCLELDAFDADVALERIGRHDPASVVRHAAVAIERFRTELRAAAAALPGRSDAA